MVRVIPQRKRYFIAVEGQGEQSFVKWLGDIANQRGLHTTFDCQPLGGGSYESMLKAALSYRNRRYRQRSKASILIVDADRSDGDDGWGIERLRLEAKKKGFNLCIQFPNQEGLLFRMLSGNEAQQPVANNVRARLLQRWPEYQKPIDARALSQKFTQTDLCRVAKHDMELRGLLKIIGLLD